MSAFPALVRREWRAYWRTPLALVYVVIFLLLSNSFVFYLGDLFEAGQAGMQSYFRLLPWVCLLLVPALSMRAWSEEFRSGTIELLDALPVPPWQTVLAKFAAAWGVAVSALLLSFPLWLSLAWLGDPDHGVIALGYVGAAAMLAAMLAVGLCLSALSENQLVVYILSALLILLYLLAGYPLALNPVRELFPQSVVDLIASLSMLTHLQSVTRGVLDLRDLLYFAVTAAFWLGANVLLLQARKGGLPLWKRAALLPLAAVASVVCYLALAFAVQKLLPPLRVDLTENRLFSLSEGSRRIIAATREPVTLTLYYSEKEARPYPQFRQYAERVSEKIGEYAAQSGGRIRFEAVDPEPYSAAEDRAIAKGILAIPLEDGSGPLYFGLTADSGGRNQSIGFIKPEAEQHLEYELSKLIQSVQRQERPKVVLVSDLPVSGEGNPLQGGSSPAWVVYRQLSERYQLSHLSPQGLRIPDDTDVLWIMHPRQWPADTLARIRDFVESGGHAVLLLDPDAESVPTFGIGNPVPGNLYLGSDFGGLLRRWGIGFDPGQVVLDSKYAWLMQLDENQFPKRNPGLISLPAEAMNQRDPVTADLDRIVLSGAGALSVLDDSPLRIEPLLQSSDSSRLIAADAYRQAAADPERLLNRFVSAQEPFVLAARFSRDKPAAGGAGINLIVIADTDFLSDRLWVVENNLFGQPVFSAQASNGDFFFNAIDQLSGSDDLISIRSRGSVSRPFDKVDRIRRTAEQAYRESQTRLLAELDTVQAGINGLQVDGRIPENRLNDADYRALAADKVRLRQELRRIQRELNADVERLGQRVKAVNIFGMPLLLLAIAAVLAWRRRGQKDFSRIGHGTL